MIQISINLLSIIDIYVISADCKSRKKLYILLKFYSNVSPLADLIVSTNDILKPILGIKIPMKVFLTKMFKRSFDSDYLKKNI